MKSLILTLFALASLNAQPVVGQKGVSQRLVTWSAASGNWSGKTRLLFLAGSVYVDTSSTGQANQFKRVDNTADSCSNPFPMAADSAGSERAIWENRLWGTYRAVDKDSSSVVFRIPTRERIYDGGLKAFRWTPWTILGNSKGYADVSIVDSVTTSNSTVTSKIGQYGLYFVAGSWARICPDDNASTADGAADSVFADSLINFTR